MTRKRFVKKLMSMGMQRNEANKIAIGYNAKGVPYNNAIITEAVKYSCRKLGKSFARMTQPLKKVAESFERLATALKDANNLKETAGDIE